MLLPRTGRARVTVKGRAVGSRRAFSWKVIGLSSLLHPPSRERHTPDRQTHERVRHVHARRGRGGVHSMGRCWRTRLRAAHQRPPAPLTRPSAGHWTEPALRVALAPRQLSPKPAASTHGRAGAWSTRGAPLGGRGAQKVEPKPWAHAAETERFERRDRVRAVTGRLTCQRTLATCCTCRRSHPAPGSSRQGTARGATRRRRAGCRCPCP